MTFSLNPCQRGRNWAVGLLALSVLVTGAPSARADNLDIQLAYQANRIVPQLEKKGYKNVGVLHFRVQRAGAKETFNLGSLSENLATRVENALIIGANADKPLGVIRDASGVAAAKKLGWFHNQEARKKLFDVSYPLAWGNRTVKADAFLTGVVKVSANLEEATLVLEVFDKTNLEPMELRKLHVDVDRSLLSDMGQTFSAGQRGLKWAKRDKAAVRDAHRRDAGESTTETAGPDDVAGFKIQVKYGDEEQAIQKDSESNGEYRVQSPRPGQKVTVVLTHNGKTDKKLACVAKMNGQSLYKMQDRESKDCQMWVFAPNEVQKFDGYYIELTGDNLKPFKVLTEEESKAREDEFGNKVGLLELDVFESRSGESEPMLISMRSISTRDLRAKPSASVRDLQDRLKAKWPAKVKLPPPPLPGERDSLLVPEGEAIQGPDIQNEAFPNPTWVGNIVIRYYNRSAVKLNISDK